MMNALTYYSKPEVQKKILEVAKDREVVGSKEDGTFLSRPDTLVYPNDILERVRKGIVAFHCSVEHWKNPMQLKSEIPKKEMDELRKGFDFIIDIDAKAKLEHAQIAAIQVVEFLMSYGVNPTIKFSGSRGFHIAIASNAFPKKIDFKDMSEKYPEVPQTLANFIREKIRDKILDELIKYEGGVSALVKTVESVSELSPYQFIDIEKNWGSRHLFRMPYSLHPKKWLISIPLTFDELKNFKITDAKPENVKIKDFLTSKDNEASDFLLAALDWGAKLKKEEIPKKEFREKLKIKISEDYFPPCIKTLLSGDFQDGRKRSLYTICSFLRAMNWTQEEIEKRVKQWNDNLARPLTDRTVNTQLKWHFRQSRDLMPANCDSDMFYKGIGVCKPDNNCGKNPVNYPFNVYKRHKKLRNK